MWMDDKPDLKVDEPWSSQKSAKSNPWGGQTMVILKIY